MWLLPGVPFCLSCLEKPWSDFLLLPVQVENGPSEFALYIVHESGGKCLPLLPDHKNKSPCPFGKLTSCAPSLGAGLACAAGTGQVPSWPRDMLCPHHEHPSQAQIQAHCHPFENPTKTTW